MIAVEIVNQSDSGLCHMANTDLPQLPLKTESMIRDKGMQSRSQIAICQDDGMACPDPIKLPNESRAPIESRYTILTCIHPGGISERSCALLYRRKCPMFSSNALNSH